MQKLQTHSKSSLFLMEMILAILILALTGTTCIRIFASARLQRQKARELNHIQELITSAGEVLEGWDGNISSFTSVLPASTQTSDTDQSWKLEYFYDDNWKSCSKNSPQCRYLMLVQLRISETEKKADLNFSDSNGDSLYQLSMAFPFSTSSAS